MTRSRRLVVSHLENVSGDVFARYPAVIKELIKGKSGVYALYRGQSLYYVGLAGNLMSRLRSHLRDHHKQKWTRFSVYLTVHNEHMRELESLLLRIADPKGNRQRGKFMDSDNLRPASNRLMKAADTDERARVLGGSVARQRVRARTTSGRGGHALAGVFERRVMLKGWHKEYEYSAYLRQDGRISYDGSLFDSPTAAAVMAKDGRRTNGWRFWHFKDRHGDWVPLRTLRKR